MVVLLYICILPSPRVFSTSALAVQYPCFSTYMCDFLCAMANEAGHVMN
jgi:hypothetical protein